MKFKALQVCVALLAFSQTSIVASQNVSGVPLFQIPPPILQPHQPVKLELEYPTPPTIPAVADTTKLLVNSIRITGQNIYDEATLITVSGLKPGSEMTLTDLRAMAGKITDHFRKNGYFLAQAYLPAQDIKDGIVTLAVVIGRYGAISINNQTHLTDAVANNLLSGLASGDAIESTPLETRLLLLSDIAGVNVSSTLLPGAALGSSDLKIELTPGPRLTGMIDADNAGLPFTGKYRLGGTVNINNLAGLGDVASLRVLSSGNGMTYGRASYQLQVGRATIGTAYTEIDYALGKEFEDLGAHGTAKIVSIFGSYPLIRTRNINLYASLGYDMRAYQDKVDLTEMSTQKRANVLIPRIYGSARDTMGGAGITDYGLTVSLGNLNIQTVDTRAFDADTAQTNGRYNKFAFNASRLQRLTDTLSLYGAINGQVASKNLDVWEKMELGGMYGVRAYPAGTAFGDQGYLLNLEARLLLPQLSESMVGRVHLVGLFDSGTIQYNKNPWIPGNNTVTLSGAGIGVMWSDPSNFSVKAYYALKVGGSTNTIPASASGQLWLQLVKYF